MTSGALLELKIAMLVMFLVMQGVRYQHFTDQEARLQVASLTSYGQMVAAAAAEYAASRANSTPAGTNTALAWGTFATVASARDLTQQSPQGSNASAWVVRAPGILTVYVRIPTERIGTGRVSVAMEAANRIGARAGLYDGTGGVIRNLSGLWSLAPASLPGFGAQPGDIIIRAHGQVG